MKPGHLPLRPSKEISLLPLHLGYCCLLNEKCISCTKMRMISPAWEWETISLCCIEAESLSQKAAQFMLSWAFSIKFQVPFLLDCNFMMVSGGMCQGSFVGELLNSINSKTIRNFHLYFQPIKRNGPRKWKFEMVWSGYIIEKGRDRVK